MYQLLVAWTRPYAFAHLALLAALVYLLLTCRERRRGLWAAATAWLAILLLSLNPVSYALLATLERNYPPVESWPADAQAIVVLSGDYSPADALRRKPELGPSTLYRCLHAVDVQAATGLPVIVSGGQLRSPQRDPGCAALMQAFLIQNGVSADQVVAENNSSSTRENAVRSAELLRSRGWTKVILVTDAMHMPRARGCFEKVGLEVCPAPCAHRATQLPGTLNGWIVPNPLSVYNAQLAVHEWMGWTWYWLRGYA